jgi:hypothetical protein
MIHDAVNLCERLKSSTRIRDVEASAIKAILDKAMELCRILCLEQIARKRAERQVELLSREVLDRDAEIAELKRAAQTGSNHD